MRFLSALLRSTPGVPLLHSFVQKLQRRPVFFCAACSIRCIHHIHRDISVHCITLWGTRVCVCVCEREGWACMARVSACVLLFVKGPHWHRANFECLREVELWDSLAADLMFKEDLCFFSLIVIIFTCHGLSTNWLLDLYISVLLQYNEKKKSQKVNLLIQIGFSVFVVIKKKTSMQNMNICRKNVKSKTWSWT